MLLGAFIEAELQSQMVSKYVVLLDIPQLSLLEVVSVTVQSGDRNHIVMWKESLIKELLSSSRWFKW